MNQKVNQSKGFSLAVMFHRSKGVCLLPALFLAFVFSLLGSGCSRSSHDSRDGMPGGKGISFTAKTIKQNSGTKTYYGDRPTSGKQPIYWSDGDGITLSSAQASSSYPQVANYVLTPVSGEESKALISVESGNGLWWGDNVDHYIYGLSPSGSLTTVGVATVTMASTQSLTADATASATSQVLLPNMNYAYLWSGVKTPKSNSVSMVFQPGFTAFEFTVGNANENAITLNSFTLSSSSCALSGEYTIAVTANSISENSTATYTVPAYSSGSNNSVSVNLGNSSITSSQTLTFTVFALPGSRVSGKENKLTDLKLSFNMTYDGRTITRSLLLKYKSTHSDPALAGRAIDIPGTYKVYTQLTLPDFKIISLDVVPTSTAISILEDASTDIHFADHEIDVTLINEDYDDGGILYDSY